MKTNFILKFGILGGLFLGLLIGSQQSTYGQTYCTPSYSTGCTVGDLLNDVTLEGETVDINNNNTGCSSGSYSDYTSLNHPDLIQGNSYNLVLGTTYSPGYENIRAWIDYDNDGTFSNSEEIAAALGGWPNGISASDTFSFTVPLTASTGLRRMRIRLVYSATTIDPCTSVTYGETEDYTVNIIPLAPPNNAGVDSLFNPSEDGNFCSGQQLVKVRLSNLGKNVLSSVDLDWSVDGVQQTGQSFIFNPPLDSIASPDNDTIITLGYVTFPYQTGVNIKAWTSNPNGVTDTDPTDDTLDLNVISDIQGVVSNITPGDTTICDGSSVILDAGQQPAGCIFIWTNGAVTRQTAINQPGDYSVIVQSLGGCFAYDTVTITQMPKVIAGDFGVVDNGGMNFTFTPINMQNVTNYHWNFGDGDSLDVGTGSPMPHQFNQTGTYAVSLTVSNDCGGATIKKQIYVQPTTGIEGVEGLEKELKVYPNPAKNKINILLPEHITINKIILYNILGQKVYESSGSGNHQFTIDISAFSNGIYNVRIRTNMGDVTQKVNVYQ